MNNKILGIKITPKSKPQIFLEIEKKINSPDGSFFHIVSLNPEILAEAQKNTEFKNILENAAVQIVDGAGVFLAGKILGVATGERIAGVDLMEEILNFCRRQKKRAMFIGGATGAAEKLAQKYNSKISTGERNLFYGTEGIKNILLPLAQEEEALKKAVFDFNPAVVFVSFGSPAQEKWIWRHRELFDKCAAMGVGGAFDFLSGRVVRAPRFIRDLGLEWFYRLLKQPWRLKRQVNLIKFLGAVLKQKFLS